MMFIIGIGIEYLFGVSFSLAMCSYSGIFLVVVVVLALVRDIVRIAFASNLDLFSVSFRSIMILLMLV